MVRYWYCHADDLRHPLVFDAISKTCYCISCDFYKKNITTINDFVDYHSRNVSIVTLLVVAEWIERFRHKPEFRKDKIKEIATHLLMEVDTLEIDGVKYYA